MTVKLSETMVEALLYAKIANDGSRRLGQHVSSATNRALIGRGLVQGGVLTSAGLEVRSKYAPPEPPSLQAELVNIIAQLRTFFLKHNAEPPIAIVLHNRHSLDLMRSVCNHQTGWQDIEALKKLTICGVGFRFERLSQ